MDEHHFCQQRTKSFKKKKKTAWFNITQHHIAHAECEIHITGNTYQHYLTQILTQCKL